MIYGYARTSTLDQGASIESQVDALKTAGCQIVRSEQVSGKSRDGRRELATLMDFMQPGDTLIVTKLDRLARSTLDMLNIITELGDRGIGVRSLAERGIDTTTAAGKLTLTLFAAVAEFERARIKERQREGIERAKAIGVYKGGRRRHDPDEIKRLKSEGLSHAEVCARLDCSEETIRRALRSSSKTPNRDDGDVCAGRNSPPIACSRN